MGILNMKGPGPAMYASLFPAKRQSHQVMLGAPTKRYTRQEGAWQCATTNCCVLSRKEEAAGYAIVSCILIGCETG